LLVVSDRLEVAHGSAALSLRSSSAPPARPSAKEQSELAREIGSSYQRSIS
jgi:hypothetical protein